MPTVYWQPQVSKYVNGDPRLIHYGETRWMPSSYSPTGVRWYWKRRDYSGTGLNATDKPTNSPFDTCRYKWLAKWRARRIASDVVRAQMIQLRAQSAEIEWEPV
jgi:hypothetical protein